MSNDTNLEAAGADDLLGRVRRAHDAELERAEEAGESGSERPPLSDGLRAAERRVLAEIDGDLEGGLVSTACEVVAGQFDSADAVREAVVDTVVEAKYDQMVAGEGRQAIVETVKETLARDAAFRAEIETMLTHAARRLGRRQRDLGDRRPETEPD